MKFSRGVFQKRIIADDFCVKAGVISFFWAYLKYGGREHVIEYCVDYVVWSRGRDNF